MKIGEMDIRAFCAKQLTVDIAPPSTQVKVEMYDGALIPSETKTYMPLGEITVGVLFRGETRNEVQRYVSDFNAALQKGVVMTLDKYERKFMGYMQSNTLSKTVTKRRYTAEFKFVGYWFGEEVTLSFDNIHEAIFEAMGNRDAPCKITMTALEYISELKISGFSEEITIQNIDRGKAIVIDGEKGIVTEDGSNKFKDVELWEFPYLKVGEYKKHHIVFSSNKLMVTFSYRPMWM